MPRKFIANLHQKDTEVEHTIKVTLAKLKL